MCRSIHQLRQGSAVAPEDDVRAAARQFVRKVTGMREPSARHALAFEAAVEEITFASQRVLDSVVNNLPASRRPGFQPGRAAPSTAATTVASSQPA